MAEKQPDKQPDKAQEVAGSKTEVDIEYVYLRNKSDRKQFFTKTGCGIALAPRGVCKRSKEDVLKEWVTGDEAPLELIDKRTYENAANGRREKSAIKTGDI